MSALLPEAAPVTVRALLIPLGTLLVWAAARGLIAAADAFVRGLFGTGAGLLAHIPWLGRTIAGGVTAIEQRMVHALAVAANQADAKIAASLHALDMLVRKLAADVRAAAVFDWNLVKWVESHVNQQALVHLLDKYLLTTKYVRALVAGVAHRLVQPVVGRVGALERWTYPRVKALEQEIRVGIPRDIAGLRARARAIENGLAAAWAMLREHERLLGIGALTAAVSVALGRLGLGWTRCAKVGRLGQAACGLEDTILEALLADALLIAGSISVVELARECQRFSGAAEGGLRFFVRELA